MTETNPRDTIGNILAYTADSSEKFGRIKLIKTLCIMDIVYYNLFGKIISGDTYLIYEHGPYGMIAGQLTKYNDDNPYIKVYPQTEEYTNRRCRSLIDNPSIDKYPEPFKNAIDGSRLLIESKSANEISTMTHKLSIWKGKELKSRINEADFELNGGDIITLRENGIIINDFEKECCKITTGLPSLLNSLEYKDIDSALCSLTKKYPTDIWSDWDDCFLAFADAVREVFLAEDGTAYPLLLKTCEYGSGMAAALAFTPNLNDWVTEKLNRYTEIFDKTADDAIGAGEEINSETRDAVNSLMDRLSSRAGMKEV